MGLSPAYHRLITGLSIKEPRRRKQLRRDKEPTCQDGQRNTGKGGKKVPV